MAEENGDVDVAIGALSWIYSNLRRDEDKNLRKLGARATSLFQEVWRDAPAGSLLRQRAATWTEECLTVLEAQLSAHEPLIGQDFLDAMALMQCRAELREASGCSTGPSESALESVVLRSAAAFINVENFLSCPPAQLQEVRPLLSTAMEVDNFFKIPFHEIISQYRTLDGAKSYCPSLDDALKTPAGMHDIFPIVQELNLPWPASRSGRSLEAALGNDLRLAAQIAQALNQFSGDEKADESCWLYLFAKESAKVLLQEPGSENLESIAMTTSILLDFGMSPEDDLIKTARKFLQQQRSAEGCIGPPPAPDLLWQQLRPSWLAARALQPRCRASSSSWRSHFAQQGSEMRYNLGHLAGVGSLEARSPPLDLPDWLGVPDFRPGGQVPVVQSSKIGGARGRGLFAVEGARPVPMEFEKNLALGDKGYLDSEVHEKMSEEKLDGYDYIVLVTLGIWFRDEFSSGDLRGTIRPLSAVLPRWQKENLCVQEINWNRSEQSYELGETDYTRTVFVASDTSECLASMANDALLNMCESDAVYSRKDRSANNLVMVPCARASPWDPEKVEFNSVWVYPRWGWKWEAGKTQELTLGYGWEEPEEASAVPSSSAGYPPM